MKHHFPAIASLLFMLSPLGSPAAHAGTPAGAVSQLSGFVMAVKANGSMKVLAPQSAVETGDTLVSEESTYVRIALADGRTAVLGPQTRLKFTSATTLSLAAGQLQVVAAAQPGAGRLAIEAGLTSVEAGAASFNLFYRPDPATAIAQRAYAQASLALASSAVQSDAGTDLPVGGLVATTFAAQYVPAAVPSAPPKPPGLYVQVLDGLIHVTNPAGAQNFSAGQFGYTASVAQPPVVVPANPGIKFTPPPSFSSAPASTPASGKSTAIDCIVR